MEKEEEQYYDNLLNKLKQDPLFDLRIEFGNLLMRHIDSFTQYERKRYDELSEILTANPTTN